MCLSELSKIGSADLKRDAYQPRNNLCEPISIDQDKGDVSHIKAIGTKIRTVPLC